MDFIADNTVLFLVATFISMVLMFVAQFISVNNMLNEVKINISFLILPVLIMALCFITFSTISFIGVILNIIDYVKK